MADVARLPEELVAHVGSFLDVADLRSCLEAHRVFAPCARAVTRHVWHAFTDLQAGALRRKADAALARMPLLRDLRVVLMWGALANGYDDAALAADLAHLQARVARVSFDVLLSDAALTCLVRCGAREFGRVATARPGLVADALALRGAPLPRIAHLTCTGCDVVSFQRLCAALARGGPAWGGVVARLTTDLCYRWADVDGLHEGLVARVPEVDVYCPADQFASALVAAQLADDDLTADQGNAALLRCATALWFRHLSHSPSTYDLVERIGDICRAGARLQRVYVLGASSEAIMKDASFLASLARCLRDTRALLVLGGEALVSPLVVPLARALLDAGAPGVELYDCEGASLVQRACLPIAEQRLLASHPDRVRRRAPESKPLLTCADGLRILAASFPNFLRMWQQDVP